jgi:hypothetical protein
MRRWARIEAFAFESTKLPPPLRVEWHEFVALVTPRHGWCCRMCYSAEQARLAWQTSCWLSTSTGRWPYALRPKRCCRSLGRCLQTNLLQTTIRLQYSQYIRACSLSLSLSLSRTHTCTHARTFIQWDRTWDLRVGHSMRSSWLTS